MHSVTDLGGTSMDVDLAQSLAEAKVLAREQMAAAWHLHAERVRELLDSGWRESVDSIVEQRFADVEARLRETFPGAVAEAARQEVERSSPALRSAARRELTESLNNAGRRLKQSESRDVWVRTLIDSTAGFCGKAALFAINGESIAFQGGRGTEGVMTDEAPLSTAPAFGAVLESLDTVVAAGTPREVSPPVSTLMGDASDRKVYLFPILLRQKAIAVLYAEADPQGGMDVSALELLAALASGSWPAAEPVVESKPEALVVIQGIPQAAPATPSSAAPWSRSEQELHLRAQRFARTRVAELILSRMPAIREGRSEQHLYRTLREEIDAGRDAFQRQFIDTCPSMVDYYHQEMVRTLAKDDASRLGSDYPGPLR